MRHDGIGLHLGFGRSAAGAGLPEPIGFGACAPDRGGVNSINIPAAGQSDLALRFAGQQGIHGAARFDTG